MIIANTFVPRPFFCWNGGRKIAQKYITGWFLIDLVSSLPSLNHRIRIVGVGSVGGDQMLGIVNKSFKTEFAICQDFIMKNISLHIIRARASVVLLRYQFLPQWPALRLLRLLRLHRATRIVRQHQHHIGISFAALSLAKFWVAPWWQWESMPSLWIHRIGYIYIY